MALLDAHVIADRVFLLSCEAMDTLERDVGAHDLIAPSNVFRHNARILFGADAMDLKRVVLNVYFEEHRMHRNIHVMKKNVDIALVHVDVGSAVKQAVHVYRHEGLAVGFSVGE